MFEDAAAYNQPMNNWDVSKVTDMEGMFYGAAAYNQPLNDWEMSKVTVMEYMFGGTAAYNLPMNDWDVSKVTDMYYMFYEATATAFNQNLNDWDVSNVTDMEGMFYDATAYNQNLCDWGTKLQTIASVDDMFSGSGCDNEADPDLTFVPPEPFCADCTVFVWTCCILGGGKEGCWCFVWVFEFWI